MKFKVSFCDPFKPDIIEYGIVESDKIMDAFERVPWDELLAKMKKAKDSDIHYSPSFEIENTSNNNGLSLSALEGGEWYIFYKRPKRVKMLFGLMERFNKNYLTEIQGQTNVDAKVCLDALINNDLEFLEEKVR